MKDPRIQSPVFGLTGGIASGKDLIAALFAELDVPIVDADEISRRLTATGTPGAEAMLDLLGRDLALPDGSPNRPALREHIFRNPEDRRRLEDLLHPLIYEEMVRLLTSHAAAAYALLVSPVLLETRQKELCDKIIVVRTERQVQVQRAMQRDGLSRDQVRRIMDAQLPEPTKIKMADFVLDNDGSRYALKEAVVELHQRLLGEIPQRA